jgi:prepilin-type N-terminal cleavage/methylation domain-containing protein
VRAHRSSFFVSSLQPTAYDSTELAEVSLQPRPGVTLLEILVVLMILLMITAAAIPMMAPALENRRMREAARLASGFFSGARARAIQTGRPFGVVCVRFEGKPWANMLAYVEQPPPYAGETELSRAVVVQTANPGELLITINADFNPLLVRRGDQIQLNFQSTLYKITDVNGNQLTALHPAFVPGATLMPWNATLSPVPYQIFRQPLRTSDTPLQLPEGIVVDLMYSGVGTVPWGDPTLHWTNWATQQPAPFDPIVTFSPNGAVDYVTGANGDMVRPTGSVYVLLGRRELMADVSKTGIDENITDPRATNRINEYLKNFWIAIGYQTGLVSTTELSANVATNQFTDNNGNGRADSGEYNDSNMNSYYDDTDAGINIGQARTIAQSGQSVGGQ